MQDNKLELKNNDEPPAQDHQSIATRPSDSSMEMDKTPPNQIEVDNVVSVQRQVPEDQKTPDEPAQPPLSKRADFLKYSDIHDNEEYDAPQMPLRVEQAY